MVHAPRLPRASRAHASRAPALKPRGHSVRKPLQFSGPDERWRQQPALTTTVGRGPGQLQVQSSAQRTRVRKLPSSYPYTQGTLRTPSCPTANLSSVQEKGKDPSTCPRTLPSSARSRGEPLAGLSQQGRQQP